MSGEINLACTHIIYYNNSGISSGRSAETYCRCLGSAIWDIPEEHAAAGAILICSYIARITPQPIFSPESPAGCDVKSSRLSCMTIVLPTTSSILKKLS